ncbi:MAG: M56 family metallopeptidase [Streptosporangiaceae bacterium]
MGTASVASRLLADAKILPSATTVRFAVLVMTLIASTGSIYGYIGLEAATGAGHHYDSCMTGVPLRFGVGGLSSASAVAVLGCSAAYTGTIVAWTLSGIVGVAFAAMAAYLVMPWWTVHVTGPWWPTKGRGGRVRPWWIPGAPRPLRPLREDRRDQRAMAERVRYLAERSGLRTLPCCVLDPYSGATAWTFGRHGEEYLKLGIGLGQTLRKAPLIFDGVVLHELAHLRNRDNRPTFMTYAAWRVFVILALVPYTITIIVRASLPDGHELVSVLALTILTYLTRNAVLRVRETHADARAALVDAVAIHSAITELARVHPQKRRLPAFLSLHPEPCQRLADLNDPGALCKPEGLAMFGAGIASGSVATNLVFTFWVGSLTTTSLRGVLLRLAAGSSVGNSHALLAAAIVYFPVLMATLPLLAGFACVTMWRAQLGALVGARQPPVIRHAVPLALGFMVGWPLSLNYAIAGTWGVFDSSGAWETADLAVSALTLCVLSGVMFRWAAETAAVWIPVTSGSLRRQSLLATLVATLGAFPPFFLWLLVHDNATITTVSYPAVDPHMSGWPLAGWAQIGYLPLTSLSSMPGCIALVALPCLYAIAGAARRSPRAAPRWIPEQALAAGAVDALQLHRPRGRIGLALLAGLSAAMVGPALALGYVIALRIAVGGNLTRYGGGLIYVATITTWITLAVCVVAAILAARAAQGMRLTIGLLTVLVGTALGSPLVTATVFVGACGDAALSCATRGSNLGVIYGSIGTAAPLQGALVVILFLIWARPTARSAGMRAASRDGSAALATRMGGAAIITAMYMGLAAGAYCCARYLLGL